MASKLAKLNALRKDGTAGGQAGGPMPMATFTGKSRTPAEGGGSAGATALGAGAERPTSASASSSVPFSQLVSESQTLLGTGAFGAVYLGVHNETGTMIAVKKITIGDASAEAKRQVEQLVGEIKLMRQLDHPNIVRYLHAERSGVHLCIYMEYVSGGSLGAMRTKFGGTLPPGVVRAYVRHALHGVAYLHGRNIVHRDIKPDNILLTSDGTAKLSDFGTSRQFNDSANLLTVTGTPWFMAPEVVKGSGHGPPADMWSVGATMLQLLTGKAPFEDINAPQAAMYHIATEPHKVLEAVPGTLDQDAKDAIAWCLRENPLQRATAAQLLQHQFFTADVVEGQALPPPPPPAGDRPALNMQSVVAAPK